MCNKKDNGESAKAAHMLLKDFIVNNPNDVVFALREIIPFFRECSLTGLQSAMNTVNVTFASVALDVIKSADEEEDESKRHYLPVGATDMQSAIYYLTKFVDLLGPLSALIRNNYDNPAIKMCTEAFGKYESRG